MTQFIKLILLTFFIFYSTLVFSQQDIWFENFEDLPSGTESDAGATAWTTSCTGASPCGLNDGVSTDYFRVTANLFMNGSRSYVGRDMDNEAQWVSESIDISGFTNVSISVDLAENGADNASDYVRAYYRINGNAEISLTNGLQSGDFNNATATVTGLSGNNLQIIIYMHNNRDNDYGFFDDVRVRGEVISLPIELFDFKGERLNRHKVLLTWATASEKDNAGFEIEVSEDGRNFLRVAFVEGAGNSSSIQQYNHTVIQQSSAYYRLKQIDVDGRFEYSGMRFVEGIGSSLSLEIYPNPSQGEIYLSIPNYDKQIHLRVFNIQGKEVVNLSGKQNELNDNLNKILPNLENGLYLFKVQTLDKVWTERIILRR